MPNVLAELCTMSLVGELPVTIEITPAACPVGIVSRSVFALQTTKNADMTGSAFATTHGLRDRV